MVEHAKGSVAPGLRALGTVLRVRQMGYASTAWRVASLTMRIFPRES